MCLRRFRRIALGKRLRGDHRGAHRRAGAAKTTSGEPRGALGSWRSARARPDRNPPPARPGARRLRRAARGRLPPRGAGRGADRRARRGRASAASPSSAAHWRAFARGHRAAPSSAAAAAPALEDHPATGVTLDEAPRVLRLGGRAARAARSACPRRTSGRRPRAGPRRAPGRGATRSTPSAATAPRRRWGWTVPVSAHPAGASPAGAEQLAGNVWEWVAGIGRRRLGAPCAAARYLDTAWGLRASRALPADPGRATATTGFRIAVDPDPGGAS